MQQSASVSAPNAGEPTWGFADPVFVLCGGRSGSTLLRFLLDAHPDLACPPETNLPSLCAQLATVWSLIEGAPLSANRGDEPPVIPEAAIDGIRHSMDRMVGSYLTRRGKKRFCDKSLGTARFAELLLRVYPGARFICLYRHPMDVIASGIEACPWGLSGYGFDQYIASTPGNAVLALARFWADNTAATMGVEEQFPDRCHRVRYEDMVADPEAAAHAIFEFLGVDPVPGISASCFSAERERFGPADHKIWYTSAINSRSVGRGWSIPIAMIPAPIAATTNEMAGKLGYIQVTEDWGTSEPPADLRTGGLGQARDQSAAPGRMPDKPQPAVLGERLLASLSALDDGLARRWGAHSTESVVAVSLPHDTTLPATRWRIDLAARTATLADKSAEDDSDWDIIGSADAWEQVILGRTNLSVALRSCQLRYCDSGDSGPLASDARIALLADLLGLTAS